MKEQLIIDADAHLRETEQDYLKRIPKTFQNRGNELFPRDNWDRHLGRMGKQVFDMDTYLGDMDIEGIDIAVVYPTLGLRLSLVKQPDLSQALAQAWNDHVGELSLAYPRIRGVAMVSLSDIPLAVRGLDRAVTRYNLEALMIHCHGHRRNLGAAEFWPIYEQAEKLGIPVIFHPHADGAEGVDRWDSFLCAHTVGFAFETMQACIGILLSGILEHCPKLKVGFFEAGCGWVPFWLDRIDDAFLKRPEEAPRLKAKPSDYVKTGRVFFTFEPDEAMLPYCLERFGDGPFLFASDYPHWDGSFPNAVSGFLQRNDITPEQKRKLANDNVFNFYTNLNRPGV